MKISEIFHSLQGEGVWLGIPAIFIRLSGCVEPYCPWCDTAYALTHFTTMEVEDVLAQVRRYLPCKRIVITGGEPFLQWNELRDLHLVLIKEGYHIQYETSGKSGIPVLHDALVVLSPKYLDGRWLIEPELVAHADYLKFVYHDDASGEAIAEFVKENNICAEKVSVMPQGKTRHEQLLSMEKTFAFCLEHGYRMSPRLHILTYDTKRGV